jgi:hypothetical protein
MSSDPDIEPLGYSPDWQLKHRPCGFLQKGEKIQKPPKTRAEPGKVVKTTGKEQGWIAGAEQEKQENNRRSKQATAA